MDETDKKAQSQETLNKAELLGLQTIDKKEVEANGSQYVPYFIYRTRGEWMFTFQPHGYTVSAYHILPPWVRIWRAVCGWFKWPKNK